MRQNFMIGFAATTIAFAASSAAAQGAGQDTQQPFDFSVKPGSTSEVLVAIARTAGRKIDVRSKDLAGLRSKGVRGTMSLTSALSAALQGSGLIAEQGVDDSFHIRRTTAGGSEIVVIGARAATASTSNRSSLSNADTPQGVQILDQKLLESRQAITAEDVLRFSSSVQISPAGNGSAQQDTVVIRGFQAPVLTGGFGDSSTTPTASSNGLGMPAIAVGQINVLKGADSILAGQMDPGGVIDVVRKVPQAQRSLTLMTQGGSYGQYIVGADATGRLFDSHALSYRLIGSSQYDVSTQFGYKGEYQRYLAPSVALRTGPLDLVVGYELNDQRNAPPVSTFINHIGIAPLDQGRGSATDYVSNNSSAVYYDGTLKPTDNLIFHSKMQRSILNAKTAYYNVIFTNTETGAALNIFNATAYRSVQLATDNNLSWKFSAGGIKNLIMAGGATQSGHSTLVQANAALQAGDYRTFTYPSDPKVGSGLLYAVTSSAYQIYLRDELTAGPVILIASIGRAHNRSLASYPALNHSFGVKTSGAWLPSIGATLKLNRWLNAYATYLRSFKPQNGFILDGGGVAPPSAGKAFEAGFKAKLAGGRAIATIDYFKSSATNVVYYNALNRPVVNPGGNSSSGVEFDVRGQITPDLYLSANYTYTNVTHQSLSIEMSAFLSSVPKDAYAVWADYKLVKFDHSSISVAGGVTGRSGYQSGNPTSLTFRPEIPAQATFDASVTYNNRALSLIGGVKNLTDKRLYGDFATVRSLPILPGRTFTLTASLKFR